jgi:vesicle coat complex subunit
MSESSSIEDYSRLKANTAKKLCVDTTDINVILGLSKHPDPQVRKASLREMCPCRVKDDVDAFWRRVIEMVDDESPLVREQVLHTICDGSPSHLEDEVYRLLQIFNRDSDSSIRRKAHKVMATYDQTGKWNIL